MDWIQKNYDRFALLLLSLVLLASSSLVIWRIQQFPERYAAMQAPVAHGSKLAALETATLTEARESIGKPASWGTHPGSLFVSRKYLVIDGALRDVLEAGGPPLHPPAPNKWFTDNNLELLDTHVLSDDADGDGFSNLDEFLGRTNPQDKNARPAYSTKLRLRQFIKQPFRLKFAAYDEESYQINTLDLKQPSQFLKLGDPIMGTKFKVLKFEQKKMPNANTGVDTDVSELTIQNVETQNLVVLVLDKVVDSPDSFALFRFLWDGSEIKVKKDQKFTLKAEPALEYKLIDIQEQEALITNLKTSDQIKIPRLDSATR